MLKYTFTCWCVCVSCVVCSKTNNINKKCRIKPFSFRFFLVHFLLYLLEDHGTVWTQFNHQRSVRVRMIGKFVPKRKKKQKQKCTCIERNEHWKRMDWDQRKLVFVLFWAQIRSIYSFDVSKSYSKPQIKCRLNLKFLIKLIFVFFSFISFGFFFHFFTSVYILYYIREQIELKQCL